MENMLARIKEIDSAILTLKAERDELATLVLAGVENGKQTVGGITFTVSDVARYSETIIRDTLTTGQAKRCEVRKLDNSIVKALYPSVYSASREVSGRKITINK